MKRAANRYRLASVLRIVLSNFSHHAPRKKTDNKIEMAMATAKSRIANRSHQGRPLFELF